MLLPALIKEFGHEIIVTSVIGGVMFLLMYPFKFIKNEWSAAKNKLDAVHQELAVQRTNCLTTIQEDGKKQIDLLTKMVDTQVRVEVATAVQTGYLKAIAERD